MDTHEPMTWQRPPLIALYSSQPRSGKSEVARVLRDNYGYVPVKMAQTLKSMTRLFLLSLDMPPTEIDRRIEGNGKEETLDGYGLPSITVRHIMRTLGKEWGRDNVADDVWVKIALGRAHRLIGAGMRVVIDDLRYPNEYEAIRAVPGNVVLRVTRPLLDGGPTVETETTGPLHESEGLLDHARFDDLVVNDGPLAELPRRVWEVLNWATL